MRHLALWGVLILAMATSGVAAEDSAARKELAPTGKLRGAVAVGPSPSALWTVRDPTTGRPKGVPVELGTAMAQKLGVPVELVEYASSGEIVAARDKGAWDVTFVPVDDDRKKVIDFGAPYHLLQSTYLVAPGSAIRSVADANKPSVRVCGVKDTATFRANKTASPNATQVELSGPDEMLAAMAAGGEMAPPSPRPFIPRGFRGD